MQKLRFSYIKRCSPDILLSVNSSTDNSQNTEAGFISYCPNCRQSNSLSSIPLNIRNCGLVSSSESVKKARLKNSDPSTAFLSQQNIEEGTLSDYWAQELIGADSVKRRVKKYTTS